jgi:hypothetical protein
VNQIGLFTGGNDANFFMDEGLVMATTDVSHLVLGTWTNFWPSGTDEDPDMLSIAQTTDINHCAILEFDATLEAPIVAFQYSFASNEYPSFTCSNFNDAFGLFVSGPGIDGPFTNGAVNIATIPGSDTPVSINTLNSGVASAPGNEPNCENANPNWIEDSMYFINNNPLGTDSEIQIPGYTVQLEAVLDIVPGETYHFKLAVCDVIDGALDSGVFLNANSLEGRFPVSTTELDPDDFTLYPNPAKDELRIGMPREFLTPSQFRVFSADGRLIDSNTIQNQEELVINLSSFDRGVYFIEIILDNYSPITKKFIVE